MARALLDANVLVSAAVNRGGTPGRLVADWEDGAFELVVSPQLLAELERALRKPAVWRRVQEVRVEELFAALRADALFVDDPAVADRVVERDPEDDYLVALARAAGADMIVTGDRHLLEQEGLTPPAVTPARFLMLLRALE